MKLIALAVAATIGGASQKPEPEVLFVPQGAAMTCTAAGGCLVTDRPNMVLILEQVHADGAADCQRGRL